jgi:perosamine synthetase
VRVEDNYPRGRDELADSLTEKGVGVAIHYPIPIYRQPLYVELGYQGTMCPHMYLHPNHILKTFVTK